MADVITVNQTLDTVSVSVNDGANSFSDGGTMGGNLQINGTLTTGVDDTGYDVKFFGDAASKFMHWDASADELKLPDSTKLTFGADDDLKIYHDGIDSYIADTGTGDLIISGSDDIFFRTAGGQNYAIFNAGGSVDLRYANATKFETTNTGATITGKLICTGDMDVSGTTTTFNSTTVLVEDPILTLGGTDPAGSDDNKDRGIEFHYHDGSNPKVGFFGYDDSASAFTFLTAALNSTEVFSGTAGNLNVGNVLHANGSAAAPSISFSSDTDTGFYYSGGEIRGAFSGNNRYMISSDFIRSADTLGAQINRAASSATAPAYTFRDDDNTGMFRAGADKLGFSVGGSEKMRLTTTGLGIGTSSVDYPLVVLGAAATSGGSRFLQKVVDTTSMASGVGGGLVFNGQTGSTTGERFLSSIHGAKTNGTDNDYGGDLVFNTRPNGGSLTEAARFDSSGLLKIGNGESGFSGSINARTKLVIENDGASGTAVSIIGKSSGNSALYFGDEGSEYSGQINYIHASESLFFATGAAEKMRLNATGLGIGGTPSRELEITGTGNVYVRITAPSASDSAALELKNTNELWTLKADDTASDSFKITNDGGTALTIDTSKAATFSGAVLHAAGSPSAPSMTFTGQTDLGFYQADTNALGITTGGSRRMVVNNTGVGIGVAAPVTTLDVRGIVHVGVDDTGHDVKFFGATAGSYMLWDESTDDLILGGDSKLGIGTTAPSSLLQIGSRGTQSDPTFADAQGDGIIFDFYNDSSPYQRHAVIAANSADSTEAVLDFWTTAVSGSATRKLTIEGNGNLRVGDGTKIYLWNANDLNYLDYANWVASTGSQQTIINTGAGGIHLKASGTNADIIFSASDGTLNELMRLDGSTSRIGIGTTTPQRKLDVRGGFQVAPTAHDTQGMILLSASSVNARLQLNDASSNDDVRLETNGDSWFNGGNVGIGTSSPAQKLSIQFADTDTSFSGGAAGAWGSEGLLIENTSGTTGTKAMIQLRNGDADIHLAGIRRGTSDSDLGFFFEGSEKMRLDSSGKLGIGLTNPSAKLEINQTATTRGLQVIRNVAQANTEALVYFTDEHTSSTQATVRIRNDGSGNALQVIDGNNSALIVDGSGNVGMGADSLLAKLHILDATFPQVRVNNATSSGESGIRFQSKTDGSNQLHADIFIDASSGDEVGRMGFRVPYNATEKMTILSDGNVGIGTATPDTTLSVDGGISLNLASVNNANHTVVNTDYCIIMHSLTQSRTIDIPTAQRTAGRILVIKERDGYASSYNVVIDPQDSVTIDGAATYTISADKGSVTLISDGSNWFVI